jgi:uncharacterized RDD family membrane protein YckC
MPRRDKPNQPADEPLLFDLPLTGPEEAAPEPPDRPAARRPAATPAPRGMPEPPLARQRGPVPVPAPELDEEPIAEELDGRAGRARRFAAGAADGLVHAAIGVATLAGLRWMRVTPGLSDTPALSVFLLAFSFLYTVLPLAFWGQTPGMAWAGIAARNRDGEPLTFGQTARRWLGGLLTLALLALPLLLTGSRRSLTDLVSGSATYTAEGGT